MLFDKLIEERETQAAESWRIRALCQQCRVDETLAMLRFSHHQDVHALAQAGSGRVRVKVPVTQ
jgi:hypothetical protein